MDFGQTQFKGNPLKKSTFFINYFNNYMLSGWRD